MIRSLDGGWSRSRCAGRTGRGCSRPPQFGHSPPANPAAQAAHHVHSKLQMSASSLSAGRSRPQHWQLGLISSISTGTMTHLLTRRKSRS
jgi:hypothetical protein